MASRLARTAFGAARLRPILAPRTLLQPALSSTGANPRCESSTSAAPTRESGSGSGSGSNISSSTPGAAAAAAKAAADPKTKAQSILDALPGNSLISKSAILSSAAGLSIYAISAEYYVLNEETVIAFCLLSVWGALLKYGGPLYSDWADAHNNRIKGILNAARADHTQAVKSRIENVKQMGGVIDITKSLFEVSKETARLEAKAYELEQTTALAAEAKAVLDSWVRYESQVKLRQQKELAESIIAKVAKELENPRVLQQILQQSVADVERIVSSKGQ